MLSFEPFNQGRSSPAPLVQCEPGVSNQQITQRNPQPHLWRNYAGGMSKNRSGVPLAISRKRPPATRGKPGRIFEPLTPGYITDQNYFGLLNVMLRNLTRPTKNPPKPTATINKGEENLFLPLLRGKPVQNALHSFHPVTLYHHPFFLE